MNEKPKDKCLVRVQFIEAINIGGEVRVGCDVKRHGVVLEKTSTGLWIRRDKWPDRWIPDSQIRILEFE